jgi:hypothetical protein
MVSIFQLVVLLVCVVAGEESIWWVPDAGTALTSSVQQSTVVKTTRSANQMNVLSVAYHSADAMFPNQKAQDRRPFWVDMSTKKSVLKLFDTEVSDPSSEDGRLMEQAGRACALQLMAVVPKRWTEEGMATLALRITGEAAAGEHSSSSSLSSEQVLGHETWSLKNVSTCVYNTQWVRREGLVGHETVRSLTVWCPIPEQHKQELCDAIQERELDLALFHNVPARTPSTATFTARRVRLHSKAECAAAAQEQAEGPGIAIATATHTTPEHALEVRLQLYAWVVHHMRLGFRTVVYDKEQRHGAFVLDTMRSRGFGHLISGSMLEYRNFSVRGVLGYEDSSQVHARSDQDKALTYTYARFEQYARSRRCVGVPPPSVLVIDFDEYVLCSSSGDIHGRVPAQDASLGAQRRLVADAVAKSRRSGKVSTPIVSGSSSSGYQS